MPPPLPRPVVWVVEDSPLEAHATCRALAADYACEIFASGAEVLERLAAGEPPSVMLLDWVLPDMSGPEVCRFIRLTYDELALPIALVTGRRDSEDMVEGLSAGANDFVVKPYAATVLLARVKSLDRTRQLAAERKLAELARTSLLDALAAQPLLLVCVLKGPELVYQMANAAYLRQVGGRDILGKPLLEALPEVREQAAASLMRQVMATGVPYINAETTGYLDRGDGIPVLQHFSLVYQPIRGASGGFDSLLVIAQDVTESVLARKAAQRLAAERQVAYDVLEGGDAVYLIDDRWCLLFVNAAFEQLTRCRREDVLGKRLWEAFPELADPRLRYRETYERAMRDRAPAELTELQPALGVWTAVRIFPIADGGLAVFVRDVTTDKHAEDEARSRAEFERQLIGIVSHDLRNPLSTILLGTQLLLGSDGADDRTIRTLTRIQSAVERGTRMVGDLLDFTQARVGGGIPVVRASGNMHVLVRQVADDMAVTAADREVQVSTSGDGAGSWDLDRMAQVLQNLVSNALKYSLPSTIVEIRSDGDASGVTVSVHNAGPAIPEESLARIFQPMQRATAQLENRSRSVGLGLFIVKHLVEAHHGRVSVTSSEAGTTFLFWVPREAPAAGS